MMKSKRLLLMLLMALIAPFAMNAQQALPYSYGFEDNDLSADGWSMVTCHNSTGINTSAAYSGSYGFRFYYRTITSSNPNQYLVSPELTGTGNGVAVSFYFNNYSSYYAETFQVGYSTTSNDPTTFTYGETITKSDQAWELYESDFPAGTKYIAIKLLSDDRFYLFLDDFNFTVPASCSKPSNLTYELTPGNGTVASLSWTENGTATQWQVCLDGDMTNLIPANTNVDFELTGLTAEVDHTAKVRAYCSGTDQSDWSNEVTFRPTNAYSLTVNNGTTANGYVPIYGYYVDALTASQFIIPAADLAAAAYGSITQLTFYGSITGSSPDWGSAMFEVYMAEVAGTTVDAMTDVSTMDKVMNAASLNIVNGTMIVNLDTPYDYMGGNLLIGFKQTVTGTYSSCSWVGVTATGASMGGYGSSINQQNFLPKTTINYIPGEAPTCPKPRNLVAGTPGARSVVLNWTETGEARNWQICLNGDETNLIPANTNEDFLLEGLTPDTDYTIKVRSYCSEDDQSDWSNEVTIHTDVTCPAPTDLTVSDITPFAANVAWSGTASSYNFAVQEPVFFYGFEDAEPFAVDDFAPCTTYDGDQTATYGFEDYDFDNENYVGACIAWQNGVIPDGEADAHSGNACGMMVNAIKSQYPTGVTHTDDWFILPELTIENGMVFSFWAREIYTNYGPEVINVGVYGSTDGTFSALLAEGVEVYTQTWTLYTYSLDAYAGQTIKLAINCVSDDIWAFMFDDIFVGYNYVVDENDIIPNATSPQALVLEPETAYQVLVQSVCGGEDGESAWVYDVFTTPSNCVAPFNLSTTDVRAKSATLNWEGYQDGFQVQYRTAGGREKYYFTDFNSGDVDALQAEGWSWEGYIIYGLADPIYNVAASSNYFLQMGWATTNEAYIYSPELPTYASGATLEFYHFAYNYDNTFQVGYSTTTNDASAFTWGNPITATAGTYTLYSEVLPDGVKYVAFKATASAQGYAVFIDDFGIFGEEVAPGPWQYGTTDGLFFNTNDNPDYPLIPDTDYEWQVRGENRSCGDEGYTEWSEMLTFHTASECELPTDLYATGITANSADSLTWTGVQQDFNVRYRTAGFDGYYINENWDGQIGDWGILDVSDQTGLINGYGVDSTRCFAFIYNDEPPQYLISPDMRAEAAGNTLSFAYRAISDEYTESFLLGFVGDSITWEPEVQTNDTTWQLYETVVPEGTEYFVIAYTANDQFALFLDDFVCYNADDIVAAGEWIETLEGVNSPVAITGLDPETYYEWQVQGNSDGCTDGVTDWVSSEFKTLESEGQTIALVAGTNWFSTYLEIELADLQAALNAALPSATSMTIKSKNSTSRWNGSQWRNANGFVWDVAKMYMIVVPEDCELVLTGDPINPAEHTINIEAGTPTWIGFPFSESKTFSEAIPAGFAVNGDQIKYQNATARFNGTNWRGSAGFTGLEPGKGYMYVPASNVTTDRILDYSFGTSKAAKTSNLNFKKEAINRSLTPKMMPKAFNSKAQAEQKVAILKTQKNEYCKSSKSINK